MSLYWFFIAEIFDDVFFFLVHWKLRFQTIRIQCPIIEKKNRDQNIARFICSFTIWLSLHYCRTRPNHWWSKWNYESVYVGQIFRQIIQPSCGQILVSFGWLLWSWIFPWRNESNYGQLNQKSHRLQTFNWWQNISTSIFGSINVWQTFKWSEAIGCTKIVDICPVSKAFRWL